MAAFDAKNKLDAKRLFITRKQYRTALAEFSKTTRKFIDLWYDEPLYGRADFDGHAVYPSEAFLKPISANLTEPIYAINFVADMFNKFMDHWKSLNSAQKLIKGGNLINLKPERAWESVHVDYATYMNALFIGFSKDAVLDGSFRNVESMITRLTIFAQEKTRYGLLTKSSFVTSKFASPLISGLMIDLKTHKHDTNREKGTFLTDPNFLIFKDAAQKFGFKLDENAPWRLIADIDHPEIETHMEPYGITKKDFYDKLYYKAFLFDIDNLKTYFLAFWNKFDELGQTKRTVSSVRPVMTDTAITRRKSAIAPVIGSFALAAIAPDAEANEIELTAGSITIGGSEIIVRTS